MGGGVRRWVQQQQQRGLAVTSYATAAGIELTLLLQEHACHVQQNSSCCTRHVSAKSQLTTALLGELSVVHRIIHSRPPFSTQLQLPLLHRPPPLLLLAFRVKPHQDVFD